MDPQDVERLAEHETTLWTIDPPSRAAGPAAGEVGCGSHLPRAGPPATGSTGGGRAPFRFLGATAVGTTLVFRFTWLDRPDPPEYLLHLDMRDIRAGDLDSASTRVLERVEWLIAEPDWVRWRTVPVSDHVRLVWS